MNTEFESKREVTGIICFFLGIALMLLYYLPEDVTGVIGGGLRSLFGGLIGIASYAIPVFLVYAAIDFFIESRAGVSPVRVRAIFVLLICVSAFFAVITMDFEYFESLCYDSSVDKFKATTAISLLWKSGSDSSLITPVTESSFELPGGLIGGLIATSLYTVCGKLATGVALIGVIASQVIIIFHISLKSTAKKATQAVQQAVRSSQVKRTTIRNEEAIRRQQMQNQMNAGANPFVNAPAGTSYNRQPRAVRPRADQGRAQYLPRMNSSVGPQPRFDGKTLNVQNPSRGTLPVDSRSGFTDMTDPAFAADTKGEAGYIKYGDRRVSTQTDYDLNDAKADFSYDSMPRSAHLRQPQKKVDEPDFLKKNAQQDFFDLSGTVFPDATSRDEAYIGERPAAGGYYRPEDDMPYEVSDTDYGYEAPSKPKIRTPHVPGQTMAPVTGARSAIQNLTEQTDDASAISINAGSDDTEGYSKTEGRIIDTSAARKSTGRPGVEIDSSTAARERKVIKANGFKNYRPAPASLLAKDVSRSDNSPEMKAKLREKAVDLQDTLKTFGITDAQVTNITHGPAITRFEVTIGPGVKVSKVKSLEDDIALAMAATAVRIEAPIPGKKAIGIEVPNEKTSAVYLRGLLETREFRESGPLTVALGKDIPGRPILCDLTKMPHLLIAGATGSGKSVCINSILLSILCKASPKDVRMILIDPKVVELSVYNGIPHLLMPVVTDMKQATGALKWAVEEMEKRYRIFAEHSVRDIKGCNESLVMDGEEPLPLMLIIIDELADLMAVASKDVETQIARLAAMARAAGIHMIIATQRPSVDVITGVIKSNIPSRIAFAVASGVDSRTILDVYGAEKLLGRGDMLYNPLSAPKAVRGQGAFVSDGEVESVVDFLKTRYGSCYDSDIVDVIKKIANGEGTGKATGAASEGGSDGNGGDEMLNAAVDVVIQAKNASVSILQRRLGIGYPRAARLIDELEKKGYIGPFEGSKPRKVLITETDWLEIQSRGGDNN